MGSFKAVMILAVLVAVSFTMEAAANPIATAQDLGMAADMSGLTSPVETAISHDLNVAEHKKKKYRGGGRGGGGGSSEEGR